MRALDFGDLEDLRREHGSGGRIFPLPPEETAGPALVIKPHRDSDKADRRTARIANSEEVGHVD